MREPRSARKENSSDYFALEPHFQADTWVRISPSDLDWLIFLQTRKINMIGHCTSKFSYFYQGNIFLPKTSIFTGQDSPAFNLDFDSVSIFKRI